ncbi:MAG: GNAT family N-acetyltransferase [SAR202 cluster bacterium]|nr:GNAT family N-acetyltransferase [SAR202 cluster bacterium]
MSRGKVFWELRPPPLGEDESSSQGQWLDELVHMRGRVLYANNRRPMFRTAAGELVDSDPTDHAAYHVLARSEGELIGCCRMVRLDAIPCSTTEELLGAGRFQKLLDCLQVKRSDTGEAGRWVAVPEARGLEVGLRLVAGAWAVARRLGLKTVVAVAGTRDGQDAALMRIGGRRVEDVGPIAAPRYADEVVVITFDVARPTPSFASLVQQMEETLFAPQGSLARLPSERP